MNIPPVTGFMTGFHNGVQYYNRLKGRSVRVIGWDPVEKQGLFTNGFRSMDDARAATKTLFDNGADIVMPVAGPSGRASAMLATQLGTDKPKIIGVDVDQSVADPEYKGVFLTSVVKRMDSTVVEAIRQARAGAFKGGVVVGTLKSGGVRLAPYHDFNSIVPAGLKSEIDRVTSGVKDGSISVER